MIRKLLLVAVLSAASSAVLAQGRSDDEAACRPDVRRFCHTAIGDGPILKCLQEHRVKLRKPCRSMLEGHGM
jgi:Cysteine rich repeat